MPMAERSRKALRVVLVFVGWVSGSETHQSQAVVTGSAAPSVFVGWVGAAQPTSPRPSWWVSLRLTHPTKRLGAELPSYSSWLILHPSAFLRISRAARMSSRRQTQSYLRNLFAR